MLSRAVPRALRTSRHVHTSSKRLARVLASDPIDPICRCESKLPRRASLSPLFGRARRLFRLRIRGPLPVKVRRVRG
eukprot:scaffold843_cov255-Pinguiococcus_pyrenoidosus.AAC.2